MDGYESGTDGASKSIADLLQEEQEDIVQFAKEYQAERTAYKAALRQIDAEQEALSLERKRLSGEIEKLEGYGPKIQALREVLGSYAIAEEETKRLAGEGNSEVKGILGENHYAPIEKVLEEVAAILPKSDEKKGWIETKRRTLDSITERITSDRQAYDALHATVDLYERGFVALHHIYEKLIEHIDATLRDDRLGGMGFHDDDGSPPKGAPRDDGPRIPPGGGFVDPHPRADRDPLSAYQRVTPLDPPMCVSLIPSSRRRRRLSGVGGGLARFGRGISDRLRGG